jgi:hypothetical protein
MAGPFWLLGRSNGRFRRFAPGCQHKHQPKPPLLAYQLGLKTNICHKGRVPRLAKGENRAAQLALCWEARADWLSAPSEGNDDARPNRRRNSRTRPAAP